MPGEYDDIGLRRTYEKFRRHSGRVGHCRLGPSPRLSSGTGRVSHGLPNDGHDVSHAGGGRRTKNDGAHGGNVLALSPGDRRAARRTTPSSPTFRSTSPANRRANRGVSRRKDRKVDESHDGAKAGWSEAVQLHGSKGESMTMFEAVDRTRRSRPAASTQGIEHHGAGRGVRGGPERLAPAVFLR